MKFLGDNKLMLPQVYFRMDHGGNMIITIYFEKLVVKDGIKMLILYEPNTNIPLLAICHNENVTEVFGSLHKNILHILQI